MLFAFVVFRSLFRGFSVVHLAIFSDLNPVDVSEFIQQLNDRAVVQK